jgi:hypothetical protein
VITTIPQRIFAVTCVVPKDTGGRLRVQVEGRTVTLAAQDGFRRTFELPRGAATEGLHWQVYGDVFELHAPYRAPVRRTDERAAIA